MRIDFRFRNIVFIMIIHIKPIVDCFLPISPLLLKTDMNYRICITKYSIVIVSHAKWITQNIIIKKKYKYITKRIRYA